MNISAQQTESYAFLRWYLEILIVRDRSVSSGLFFFFSVPVGDSAVLVTRG